MKTVGTNHREQATDQDSITVRTNGWPRTAMLARTVAASSIPSGQLAVRDHVGYAGGMAALLERVVQMRVAQTTSRLLLLHVEAHHALWEL